MPADIVKIVFPAVTAFVIGIIITPIVTHYLYKYKIWKTRGGKCDIHGNVAHEFNKMHAERERCVPRMGGIVIWGSVILTVLLISLIAYIFPTATTLKMDFLSRSQTWIPLFALLTGSLFGLVNDILDVRGEENGMSLRRRLLFVTVISGFIGWWFYAKLGITSIAIPFDGEMEIGWLIIPFFIFLSHALYASGIIDGIDGLSSGVFTTIFATYAGIAFYQQQIDLAAFSATLMGAQLAFMWFNIPPARFFMTETGTMGITLTIAVIAFMTDTMGGGIGIFALPVIGGILVATVLSVILQIFWKKVFKKKLFKIAPIHHHFEAIGWPSYKVTMRYWIVALILSFSGFIFALIG